MKPFREVDVAKVRYLSADECRQLVNATAAEFRPLVQAALLTGCRYGELTALRIADFDHDAGTVTVRASKAGKPRHVVLTEDGVAFFSRLTSDRPANSLIFYRQPGALSKPAAGHGIDAAPRIAPNSGQDGDRPDLPWGKSHQHRPLRLACATAGISPPASFHILRHTYASQLVMAGVPLQVIAANLGHSDTRMTERHYAHLAPSYVANTIRAAVPRLGLIDGDSSGGLAAAQSGP